MEGRCKISVSGDRFDVLIPSLARVGTQLLRRFAEQKVPGALQILDGERSAVMPLDILAQPESQSGAILAPRPAGGEVRNDRLQAVLRYVLVVHDEIVEAVTINITIARRAAG